jgi:hypothetical protein
MICTMKRNSACNCKKIPAVASSAVIRKIALCTAFRRVTTKMAEDDRLARRKIVNTI